jgi:GT2 family glycosyltransferase
MKISYVIVTANRRDRLLATLDHLYATTPLPEHLWETWVVDNGSTDGTIDAVVRRHPSVRVIELPQNIGMAARNIAMQRSEGEVVILLDDDSYPTGDAVPRLMQRFDDHPMTGAIVGRVVLPDGRCEASALPGVMIGCASAIRRSVIDQVGCFAPEFFIQAEEYDLSFRIWAAGWQIERLDEAIFRHDKVLTGRSKELTVFRDLRNNLLLCERFLPRDLRVAYRRDWTQRYTAIARSNGHLHAARRARRQARWWGWKEMLSGRQVLQPAVIESVFELERQRLLVRRWAEAHAIKRVVIGDLGKNIYATWRACLAAGLEVPAIANAAPAFRDLRYRTIPLLDDRAALAAKSDGIVISNINPAQLGPRYEQLTAQFDGPVLALWSPASEQPIQPIVEAA